MRLCSIDSTLTAKHDVDQVIYYFVLNGLMEDVGPKHYALTHLGKVTVTAWNDGRHD